MAIYQRDSGIYWIDVRVGPPGRKRRVRRSAGTRNRAQAQEYHDRVVADAWRQSRLGERPSRSWRDAVVSYMVGREHRASYDQDRQRLRWLDPHLSALMLTEIDEDVLTDVLHARMQKVAASTANRTMVLVRAILRHAEGRRWIDRVPRIPMAEEGPGRLEWLTVEEVDALMDELRSNARTAHVAEFVDFATCTGLRMRNITHLRWDQVDAPRRTAWIHRDQAKGRRAIPIALSDAALAVIRRQMGKHHERVFTCRGKPYDRVNVRTLDAAAKRAGIQKHVHPHLFRHTWASWHVISGTTLAALMELGGWAKIESVMVYAHLSAEHLRASANRLDALRCRVDGTQSGTPRPETTTAPRGGRR